MSGQITRTRIRLRKNVGEIRIYQEGNGDVMAVVIKMRPRRPNFDYQEMMDSIRNAERMDPNDFCTFVNDKLQEAVDEICKQ